MKVVTIFSFRKTLSFAARTAPYLRTITITLPSKTTYSHSTVLPRSIVEVLADSSWPAAATSSSIGKKAVGDYGAENCGRDVCQFDHNL